MHIRMCIYYSICMYDKIIAMQIILCASSYELFCVHVHGRIIVIAFAHTLEPAIQYYIV